MANQKPKLNNGLGINGTTRRPFGAVTIRAACAPQRVSGHVAFLLPCGGTLTQRGESTVQGQTQLVDATGASQGVARAFSLAKGQSLTLAAPPSGQQWLIVDLSNEQIAWTAIGTLAGIVTVAGLSTYGLVAIVERMIQRHKRKVAMRRLSRWFWGS